MAPVFAEPNAILNFLAQGSEFLSQEPRLCGHLLQWQFFEQSSHEPYVAVARFIQLYQGLPASRRTEYAKCRTTGYISMVILLAGRQHPKPVCF